MDRLENALRPGTILHGNTDYTIKRVLGAGGFGITYLASMQLRYGNIVVDGKVAIKEHFLGEHSERQPDSTVTLPNTAKLRDVVDNARKDFIAEARRLSQVGGGNDNIVKVNEIFEANGTAYYVMEYLEGQSLHEYIHSHGPLDGSEVRAIVGPVVGAVAYLHANNMTHLDIKPANIMLTVQEDGTVRPVLIDFGLSKHYDENGNATSTINTRGASDGYSPIEQYHGISSFSPVSDVYSLGATMLACATGTRPSTAGMWSPGEPARTIAALPVDDTLRRVIDRAMLLSAADRYPDAGAMLADLGITANTGGTLRLPEPDDSKDDNEGGTEVLSPRPKRPYKPLIIAAIVAAAIVAGFFAFRGDDDAAPEQVVAEQALREEEARRNNQYWDSRRTPNNLYLAVSRNSRQYYLSQSDYSAMSSSDRSSLNKLGVVIIGNSQCFILALEDEANGEIMNWDDAMRRYGSRMPTKEQGEAWMNQVNAVADAVRAFGGHCPRMDDKDSEGWSYWYWTKTEYNSSFAWFLHLNKGFVNSSPKTNNIYRVRTVVPVVESGEADAI